MGKIKHIGLGFIQIGAAKSHRHAIKDFWKHRKRPSVAYPDRMTMTFGCTDLNETNAIIFCILSLVSLIF
jgi:hypothetical protein